MPLSSHGGAECSSQVSRSNHTSPCTPWHSSVQRGQVLVFQVSWWYAFTLPYLAYRSSSCLSCLHSAILPSFEFTRHSVTSRQEGTHLSEASLLAILPGHLRTECQSSLLIDRSSRLLHPNRRKDSLWFPFACGVVHQSYEQLRLAIQVCRFAGKHHRAPSGDCHVRRWLISNGVVVSQWRCGISYPAHS